MFLLEVLSRVVGIVAGIVGSLVGITTLSEKGKSYINGVRQRQKKTHQQACKHLMGRLMIA